MTSKIQEILNDLYIIDPELKKHESELEKIITELLASKPDTKFNQDFAYKLRGELVKSPSEQRQNSQRAPKFQNFLRLFNADNLRYAGIGAMITVLIAAPLIYKYNNKQQTEANGSHLSFNTEISKVDSKAFGSLVLAAGSASRGFEPDASANGLGGGGDAGSSGASGVVDGKMIAPADFVYDFNYTYSGEPVTIAETSMDVLKRAEVKLDSARGVLGLLPQLNLGPINLSTFSNQELNDFSIKVNGDYGYIVNVALNQGNISINQNWNSWPMGKCQDQECFDRYRVQRSDIPDDNSLIAIANDFLKKHNIGLENYGDPVVTDNWVKNYETAADKDNFYFPDAINVVYPLKINGKLTYEQFGGNPYGLTVGINIKAKRVASVNELTVQRFNSSSYEIENSWDKLLSIAEKGGPNQVVYNQPVNKKIVDVELGTPTIQYSRTWKSENNQAVELLVPSLVFPVTKLSDPEHVFFQKNIIVPLPKDMLAKQDDGGNGGGPIRIMDSAPKQ